MKNNNYIQEELRSEAPYLAEIDSKTVLSLPSNYFQNLSSEIIQKIKAGQEAEYRFSNSMPYTVPNQYFANLSKSILEKIVADKSTENPVFEEMEEISPLLNTINKNPVNAVPQGYFDTVSFTATTVARPAKVVSLAGRGKRFITYAIAAVIATILAVSIFLLTDKKSTNSVAVTEHNSQVKNLSDEEIVNFLKTNSANEDIGAATLNAAKESDIKKSVRQMSDQEIKEFLLETGEADEI